MNLTIKNILATLIIIGLAITLNTATAHSWDANLPLLHDQKTRSDDIWVHIRRDFHLRKQMRHPKVQKQVQWLLKHKPYLTRLFKQSAPYLYYIYHEVKKRNMPAEIALLPVIESAYNPFAYSKAGAAGLWQLMPGTGTGLGLKQNWWYDGRRDIYASTKAALQYMKYLHDFFHHNWILAMAAYDSGEGTVQHAIRRQANKSESTLYWDLPLPRETKAYIPRLLAICDIIYNAKRYKVKLPRIIDEPYFDQIEIGRQVDLAQVAKIAEIQQTELYKLNPGYNRWATDPNGPYALVLPIDKIQSFRENMSQLSNEDKITWRYYIVKPNDNLSSIASRFQTTPALLKAVNKLKNKYIHPGNELLIPETAYTAKKIQRGPRRHIITSKIAKLGPNRYVHHVKHFETMEQIARKYKVKAAAIRFWNRLKRNKIKAGQELVIWSKRSQRQVDMASIRHYKIKSGDNLTKVAHRYHVSLKKLEKFNPKLKSKVLSIGQRIDIPPVI